MLRDHRTHRKIPPVHRSPPPAASAPSTTRCISPVRQASRDTRLAQRGLLEMLRQSPTVALRSTLSVGAKSLARCRHPARTRSWLLSLWCRKPRTVPSLPAPATSTVPPSQRATSSRNSVCRRPCAQSPRNSLPESSAHTLLHGWPHESG